MATVIGTAPLASGVATLVYTPPGGADSYQATYAGDCSFSAVSSNNVTGTTLLASDLDLGDARTDFLRHCTERRTIECDG